MPFSYFKDFMVVRTHSSFALKLLFIFPFSLHVSLFLAIIFLELGICTEADGGERGESSMRLATYCLEGDWGGECKAGEPTTAPSAMYICFIRWTSSLHIPLNTLDAPQESSHLPSPCIHIMHMTLLDTQRCDNSPQPGVHWKNWQKVRRFPDWWPDQIYDV